MIVNTTIPISKDISNSGFLCGFNEGEVEKPAEGVDGDCVIHYVGEHKECKMVVKLVNGMRDGRAVIVNNGFAYLKLEYQNGKLTGSVERLNRYLMTELKGYLENGIEVGLFEEYGWKGRLERNLSVREAILQSDEKRNNERVLRGETGRNWNIAQYFSIRQWLTEQEWSVLRV